MLKRSLAAVVALGLLFFGATVSLEALGLLFRTAVPDLQQRVEAFVARLEADLSPVDLPEEPVEVSAAQELAGHDAERAEAAEPALEGQAAATTAQVADAAEPDGRSARIAAAFSSKMPDLPDAQPDLRPETAAEPDHVAMPAPAEPQEFAAVPALPAVVQPASAAPVAGPPSLRAVAVHRATSARGPTGYAAFGWPLLDWLTL
jgi:hypothetical protein